MKKVLFAVFVVTALSVQTAGAKTLEDVLKEKGVITEEEYKEVTKSKPLDYKLGKGFTFTSPDEMFQLSLGGRLQARYTFTDLDASTATTTDSSKWEVRRMKFWMNGYAYTKDLTYLLQIDVTQGSSSKLLEHAYLNYRLLDEVQILAGQTKIPFGRQWLNSSGALQFVDRSTVSDAFRPGYDAGAKLNGDLFKGLATYELGIYGGAGQSTVRTSNDNAFAARVTVNPFGKMPYAEADLDQTVKPLLSVGANFFADTLMATFTPAVANDPATIANETKAAFTTLETNNLNFAGSNGWLGKGLGKFTTSEKLNINTMGFDAAFKWYGFSALGEYIMGQAEGTKSGKLLRAQGLYGQAGYCIIPKTLELAFRYSYFDPDRDVSNDLQTDIQGAVSYYFNKHNLKLQGDVTNSHIQHTAGPTEDMIYRLQAQVIF